MNLPCPASRTVLAIALALALTGCGKTPEQNFQRAQELAQKGDYRAAVIELKTVLQAQPDNGKARLLLGDVYVGREAYADAEKELSKARSLGVSDEEVLPALAKTYVHMGTPQKALDLGTPATVRNPEPVARLYAIRAQAQLALGEHAEAEQSLGAAQRADPNEPELLLTRAKLALANKQNDQALSLVDAALQRAPQFTEALYLKAALLDSSNKPDDAIKVYQQILANDSYQYRADLAISGLQLRKGDLDGADKAVQAAEKVAKKAPLVRYARGMVELQRGNLDKANAAFLDVLRVAPDHLPTALAYAMTNFALGHYEQSITYAEKVLQTLPNDLPASQILAGSLLKTGDIDGAIRTLSPLLPRFPNDPKLLALAGDAYLQAKNYDKAMSYLERAAQLAPNSATIKTRLAAGHLGEGNSEKAMEDLAQAASLSEKAGKADLALVVLHLSRKEYDQALEAIAALEKKLPDNPVTLNLRAGALLGKQDVAGARKALEEALAIQPTFFPAAANLARLDMAENKPDAARARFEAVLAKDKNNLQAMLALADLALVNKQEDESVAWLKKASKADPKAIAPRVGLARYYLAKKDNQKALAVAKDAASANPDDVAALNLLASTQLATGDRTASINTYVSITQKAPRSPDAFLRLAFAQAADKQANVARSNLEKALQIKADFLPAQDAMLQLDLAENKPEAALDIARQMQTQQPQSPIGFEREGDVLISQKRYAQAVKLYEQSMAKGPATTSMIKLHRALLLAGNSQAADQQLAGWLKEHPADLEARNYAAEVYLLTKRDREAIAQYQELLKSNPNNVIALNNLASLYLREKDNRAAATAEQALKLAPAHPAVQDTLGWILVTQGQLPRGVELLSRAAAGAPKFPTIRYHYGVALARSGNKAQAKKEFEAAIAIGQHFPELEDAKSMLHAL